MTGYEEGKRRAKAICAARRSSGLAVLTTDVRYGVAW